MKQDIRNYDNAGLPCGKQISYYDNDNISSIRNFHHNNWNGYQALFKSDNSIHYKSYWNMDKWIYSENHRWSKQIKIKI